MDIIFENWALGDRQTGKYRDDSFCAVLHDTDEWVTDLYWPLDKAFFDLGDTYGTQIRPMTITRAVVDIFLYVNQRLATHRMADDLCSIRGVSNAACFEWSERLEGAFRTAVYGSTMENFHFEFVNPLMVQDN